MPYKDPKKNAERMRKRRAEGTSWEDPFKEFVRKAHWYYQGGDERRQKIVEGNRQRRQQAKEQGLQDFTRKLK